MTENTAVTMTKPQASVAIWWGSYLPMHSFFTLPCKVDKKWLCWTN